MATSNIPAGFKIVKVPAPVSSPCRNCNVISTTCRDRCVEIDEFQYYAQEKGFGEVAYI